MAIGNSRANLDVKKLSIFIGSFEVLVRGKLSKKYDERKLSDYMKNDSIEVTIDLALGDKKFTAYTMDLTKKYVEINADYRS